MCVRAVSKVSLLRSFQRFPRLNSSSVTFCCRLADVGSPGDVGGRKRLGAELALPARMGADLPPGAVLELDRAGVVAAHCAGAAPARGTVAGSGCSPSTPSSFSTIAGNVAHASGSMPIARLAAATMGSAPTVLSGRPSAALMASTLPSSDIAPGRGLLRVARVGFSEFRRQGVRPNPLERGAWVGHGWASMCGASGPSLSGLL